MSDTPDNPLSSAGDGGSRDGRGRFVIGNKAGKGNPLNRKVQKLRAALLRSVKPTDIAQAAKMLVQQAKQGDRFAFAELLDRTIGRAVQLEVLVRLEALEDAMQAQQANERNLP
jgi:hypothetical protein